MRKSLHSTDAQRRLIRFLLKVLCQSRLGANRPRLARCARPWLFRHPISRYVLAAMADFTGKWNSNSDSLRDRTNVGWTIWILLFRLCSSTDQWKRIKYGWCLSSMGNERTNGRAHIMKKKSWREAKTHVVPWFPKNPYVSLCCPSKSTLQSTMICTMFY